MRARIRSAALGGQRAARRRGAAALACVLLAVASGATAEPRDEHDRFDVVVIDAGHGGEDEGAHGPHGMLEKDLVLDVARRAAARLRKAGLEVVMTRDDDVFVPLEARTAIANDARGDLFLSVHANWAKVRSAHGIETYFVSQEASDEAARRVAERENEAFGAGPGPASGDPLVAILGDLIATEHVMESDEFARMAQGELAGGSASRGVKQAPFVVLMGVQMPASLVEIGFLSNARDAASLRRGARRDQLAEALARAVRRFGERYDARRGVGVAPAAPAGGGR